MGDFLITIFWWAVKIFGILILWCLIAGPIIMIWFKKKPEESSKVLEKLNVVGNLERKMDAKFEEMEKSAKMKSAQSGDIYAIKELYGFTDNDVKSKEYAEILKALGNARSKYSANESSVKKLRDIVLYKLLDNDKAEQYLHLVEPNEADFIRKYKLFQKLLKGKNMQKARNTLGELEKNGCLKINSLLLGVYYYHAGVSYENGSNGFEKDIKKAYGSYNKAVSDFGSTDAMLPLGILLLSGEVDGVIVNRDYFTANDYINTAALAGNSDAKEIIDSYGVDGAILKPMTDAAVTYRFMYGCELTAPAETIKYLQVLFGIRFKATDLANSFSLYYSKQFTSFSNMINGVDKLYRDHINQMLDFGIQVLLSYGIDDYDIHDLVSACGDLSLSSRTKSIQANLDRFDSQKKQLNSDLAYTKENRSRWVGGGFGTTIGGTIKASIKGSIAAEAMNIGTGVLHDIGGGIVKGINNAATDVKKNELFQDEKTKYVYCDATFKSCFKIGHVVKNILEERSKIKLLGLIGKITYQGENFAGLDDKALTSKINNNIESEKYEYLNAMLIEQLRRRPFNKYALEKMYKIAIKTNDASNLSTLRQYAGDFGLELPN